MPKYTPALCFSNDNVSLLTGARSFSLGNSFWKSVTIFGLFCYCHFVISWSGKTMVSVLQANLISVGLALCFVSATLPHPRLPLGSLCSPIIFSFLPQYEAWSQDSLNQQNNPVSEDRVVIACVFVLYSSNSPGMLFQILAPTPARAFVKIQSGEFPIKISSWRGSGVVIAILTWQSERAIDAIGGAESLETSCIRIEEKYRAWSIA